MNAQNTLNSAIAAGFDGLSERDIELCILYGVSNGGAVQHGTGTPTSNSIPVTPPSLYINDTDGTLWAVVAGVWKNLV